MFCLISFCTNTKILNSCLPKTLLGQVDAGVVFLARAHAAAPHYSHSHVLRVVA